MELGCYNKQTNESILSFHVLIIADIFNPCAVAVIKSTNLSYMEMKVEKNCNACKLELVVLDISYSFY